MTSHRPLRIALFSGNYNYLREGANLSLNTLVGHLEQWGHRLRVYSPVTATPAFAPQGTLVPVPSIRLPVRTEFQLALGIPPAIRRDVEAFAPDLIHVSTPDLLGTRAETLAKRLGVPILASYHTRFETYLEHYGIGWLRPLAEGHLRRFYRRADHVVAPTPTLVEELKRIRGDDRASVWSRGVDRVLFDPARRDAGWRKRHGWDEDDVVVLFFGRPVVEKGIHVFVEAVRQLQHNYSNVRPLVVGAGPAADRFRALASVTFTGHLDGEALATAVASADIMLHPSTTESFGNVMLEAMASGLAIIAAEAPSAFALIEDGRTGILCPPGDAQAFAQAARRLIEMPGERRILGSAARAASKSYIWESASRAVEAAYFQMLSDFAGRRRALNGRSHAP